MSLPTACLAREDARPALTPNGLARASTGLAPVSNPPFVHRIVNRVALTCFLLFALLATRPLETSGQVGVPVTDVGNLGIELIHNLQQDRLTADAVFNLLQIYQSMQKTPDPVWRNIHDDLRAMDMLSQLEGALGYSDPALQADLERLFPGTPGYAGPWPAASTEGLVRIGATARQSARALQHQQIAWTHAADVLDRYHRDLTRIFGPQSTTDLLLQLDAFALDEWQLIRQLLAQETVLHVAASTHRTNWRLQTARTLHQLLGQPPP